MSYLRPSSAVDFVSPVMPCFDAVYGAEFARGACAEIEPLLMMRPPRGSWLFMMRNACCVHRNAPVRFVSITRRHCSNGRSSSATPSGVPTPALLNNTSSRPNRARVAENIAVTWSGCVTSHSTTSEGAAPADAATASSLPRSRPASTTANPSARKACAVDLPIPLPAPVMSATFRSGMRSPSDRIRLVPAAQHELREIPVVVDHQLHFDRLAA